MSGCLHNTLFETEGGWFCGDCSTLTDLAMVSAAQAQAPEPQGGGLTERELDAIIEAAHPSRPDKRELTQAAVERILAARAVPAETLADRVRAGRLAQAYSDGYNDAVTMVRCYGHTDHWPDEDEPRNPFLLDDPADQPTRCDCPPELMGAFGDHATNCPSREDGEA